jgi:rhamnosyl/mannosyltransferase
MRVLHFYKTAFPDTRGGVEQVIDQIARSVNALGIKSDVLSLTRAHVPRTILQNGYFAHRARLNFQIASTGFSASSVLRFWQLTKKADVIHYHFPWPFMDLVHFLTRVKKPTVVTYHSDIVRQKHLLNFYKPIRNKFLTDVNRIVTTSPNYLDTSDVLDRYRDKVDVIPIGLDEGTYPVPADDKLTYWKERFGGKFYLFVGVLRYYKGLHILMEALKQTNYPVVLIGTGPTERALKQQAMELGLKNVHFLGYLPEMDKVVLLKLCFGVLFPSHLRSEAFGVSLLEGAMYGKPLISSEIGTGTTFINIANETGLVVPPGDPGALQVAMRYLWENPDIALEMGRNARTRYLKHFTAATMAKSYGRLYRRVLDGANTP